MKLQLGRRSLFLRVLGACMALLLTGTLAHAQSPPYLYQFDWAERFNNSLGNETEDMWVANSFTAQTTGAGSDGVITSIILPIGDTFTDQPITGLIYQGADIKDPTAGGGLKLVGQKATTFTSVRGTFLTITFDDPGVSVTPGQPFYAAVLIPGVPGNKFPLFNDSATGALGMLVQTQALGRSFFDVGLTLGGPYDINQLPANSANITVFGGVHPVLPGNPGDIQSAGNLALWVAGH
jgi:hypothetical protein